MGLGVFVVSILSVLHVDGFLNGLLTPPVWDLISFKNDDSLPSPNFSSSTQNIITNFSEAFPP